MCDIGLKDYDFPECAKSKKEHIAHCRLKGETVDSQINRVFAEIKKTTTNTKQAQLNTYLYVMRRICERKAFIGDCVHYYFIGDGFGKWLKECCPEDQTEQFRIAKQMDVMNKPIIFHVEGINTEPFLVQMLPDPTSKYADGACVPLILVLRGKTKPMLSYHPFHDNCEMTSVNGGMEMAKDYSLLINGCLAYIEAFPDMVKNGVPEGILKSTKQYNFESRTITPSPVIYNVQNGVSPHYRTGHFRCLSNECFVNKKGKIIFVHGCFVKGVAKTVIGIDNELQQQKEC
jgi:hypothetical protein